MILGSHNSWSYLPARKWWMTPFKFIAKCQDLTIKEQYYFGVRCFDLRIRFSREGDIILAHGFMEYKYDLGQILYDLNSMNNKRDCFVRIIHEARNKSQYTPESISYFVDFCIKIQELYPNIKFWCGRNLYNWECDYKFKEEPSCEEKYSSVCKPRLIDDWYPRLFAYMNNKKIIKEGTDKDILLIDFVNYADR